MKFDRFLLRLPLIGRLIRDLHAARLARTLSTMVASRLPLLEGLKLTTATVHNRVLRAASADIAETVRTGGSLSGALRKAGIFPPLLVYLAASGEASGKLDVMLERAADYLEREFDAFTTTALVAARAGDHHRHGRGGRADRAVDPAPDPATRYFGWWLLMRKFLLTALRSSRRRRRAQEGFTLVELMVVIVIIGLLATVVIINVVPALDTRLGDARRRPTSR